jgi:hypothetical protein
MAPIRRLLNDLKVVVREVPDDGAGRNSTRVQRAARSIAELYLAMVAAMIVWVIYLAFALPERNTAQHYDLTWVGFDLMIVAAMFSTAWFALKLDSRVELAANSTATLLFVDAWMDVTTASSTQALITAVLFAIFLELPIAIVSLRIARRINRSLSKRAAVAEEMQPAEAEEAAHEEHNMGSMTY